MEVWRFQHMNEFITPDFSIKKKDFSNSENIAKKKRKNCNKWSEESSYTIEYIFTCPI